MTFARTSQQAFFGTSALLFVASATLTTVWCGSMSAMGEMPMPGGWTMSMAWMPMPGKTWAGTAAVFVGMWVVMMVAMMLPSLLPMLWRYRQAVREPGAIHLDSLTLLVAMGYFCVWIAFGIAAFALGVALAAAAMQSPPLAQGIPVAAGAAVVIAGALQFSAWKIRHLDCCRSAPQSARILRADAGTAWRYGVRLGIHCCNCCAGLTIVLLVLGVMNLGAMVLVTGAITVERLAPAATRVARTIGVAFMGAGLVLIAKTAGLG